MVREAAQVPARFFFVSTKNAEEFKVMVDGMTTRQVEEEFCKSVQMIDQRSQQLGPTSNN